MLLRALLVTKDDGAVETLAPVLEHFGLAKHSCGYGDAVCLVSEQRFHAVLVDFDDPHSATLVLDSMAAAPCETHPVTVALLADRSKVRKAFGAGARFIVYKPVTREQAEGTLRAATSLIHQDRRTSFRIPVQVPVTLSFESGGAPVEGLLLDLSADGVDLLSPQPLYSSARLGVRFTLLEFPFELNLRGEVQWANPNGESGVRFTGVPERVRSALRRWLEEHRREATGESIAIQNCKLTDLSLGACYIQTSSPFPEGTHVTLALRAGDSELHAHGQVRVMHPSHGMGIEFAAHTVEACRETERFIRFLGGQPGLEPELQVSPRSRELALKTDFQRAAELEDPLLELLRNHEALTQERFLETLEGQRKIPSTPRQ